MFCAPVAASIISTHLSTGYTTTDSRLVVVDTTVEYFRGMVPVICEPTLTLLPRQDIRYQLPVA